MQNYTLVLRHSAEGRTRAIHFTARDPSRALALAHRHNFGGSAELWVNGKRLCRLHHSPLGFWTIEPLL